MYKSYHYDNMPLPVKTAHSEPSHEASPPISQKSDPPNENRGILNELFSDLKNDDIILLIVIFILLTDNCDDKLLLIILGFIFFSGLGE